MPWRVHVRGLGGGWASTCDNASPLKTPPPLDPLHPYNPFPPRPLCPPLPQALLHPKSVYLIPGCWHGLHSFDGWGDGLTALGSVEVQDALIDRVRVFGEQCDQLHGGGGGGAAGTPIDRCVCMPASVPVHARVFVCVCHCVSVRGGAGFYMSGCA